MQTPEILHEKSSLPTSPYDELPDIAPQHSWAYSFSRSAKAATELGHLITTLAKKIWVGGSTIWLLTGSQSLVTLETCRRILEFNSSRRRDRLASLWFRLRNNPDCDSPTKIFLNQRFGSEGGSMFQLARFFPLSVTARRTFLAYKFIRSPFEIPTNPRLASARL